MSVPHNVVVGIEKLRLLYINEIFNILILKQTTTITYTTSASSFFTLDKALHYILEQRVIFPVGRDQKLSTPPPPSTTMASMLMSRHLRLCRSSLASPASSSILHRSFGATELDLSTPLPTNEDNEQLSKIRHSTAHVMAMAVQRLHPEAKVTLGPVIDNGFYYDFFFPEKQLSDADLRPIKK